MSHNVDAPIEQGEGGTVAQSTFGRLKSPQMIIGTVQPTARSIEPWSSS